MYSWKLIDNRPLILKPDGNPLFYQKSANHLYLNRRVADVLVKELNQLYQPQESLIYSVLEQFLEFKDDKIDLKEYMADLLLMDETFIKDSRKAMFEFQDGKLSFLKNMFSEDWEYAEEIKLDPKAKFDFQKLNHIPSKVSDWFYEELEQLKDLEATALIFINQLFMNRCALMTLCWIRNMISSNHLIFYGLSKVNIHRIETLGDVDPGFWKTQLSMKSRLDGLCFLIKRSPWI